MTVHTNLDLRKADEFQARRVVNYVDADGKSAIVEDGLGTARISTPAFTAVDLWRWDSLPAPVQAGDTLGEPELVPPAGAAAVRMACFPPDSEVDLDGFAAALAAVGGDGAHDTDSTIAMLHATDTIDVAVVVSGEIVCVTEQGETTLRQGDSLVQRGNRHAWSNRSNAPAVLVYTMVSATR
jgi:hypothetical protein